MVIGKSPHWADIQWLLNISLLKLIGMSLLLWLFCISSIRKYQHRRSSQIEDVFELRWLSARAHTSKVLLKKACLRSFLSHTDYCHQYSQDDFQEYLWDDYHLLSANVWCKHQQFILYLPNPRKLIFSNNSRPTTMLVVIGVGTKIIAR